MYEIFNKIVDNGDVKIFPIIWKIQYFHICAEYPYLRRMENALIKFSRCGVRATRSSLREMVEWR